MKSPWNVLGPATANQTPQAIRRRYQRSFMVLAVLLGIPFAAVVFVGEPSRWYAAGCAFAAQFLTGKAGWEWLLPAAQLLIPCGAIMGVVCGGVMVLVWVEQKVAAHMQLRLGPMRVGGWHGWAQLIADGVKLFLKEDIVPTGADKWVHLLAPIVGFLPAYVCFAAVPFGKELVAVDLDVGVLFILGMSGLSVVGLLMAGWSSNNKYSALGGLRAAAQLVSYEVPRVISVLPVVMWTGTLSLSGTVQAQAGLWKGFLPKWFIFYPVVGQISFLIYLISSVAETNRVPFDIAEAESELVSGFHTEYSGMKFALFFLTEYAYVFLGCALGAVLFLGGGEPLPRLEWIPSYVWFFGKTFFLVFLFMAFRWTYPRLRVDRLMEFCWKFLFPWALVNVALAGVVFLWRAS